MNRLENLGLAEYLSGVVSLNLVGLAGWLEVSAV